MLKLKLMLTQPPTELELELGLSLAKLFFTKQEVEVYPLPQPNYVFLQENDIALGPNDLKRENIK